MTHGDALSFAISGLRGTGRTPLYRTLEIMLPKIEHLREYDFEFIGNPFERLPHPLLWESTHKRHGLSRLFECWGMLNDFAVDRWLPAVKAGKIPIMDSCGLDAVLYATACIGCNCEDNAVLGWHHTLVRDRLVLQGLQPPYYLLTSAPEDVIVEYLVKQINHGLTREQAKLFIEKELVMIHDYFFGDGSGQKKPFEFGPDSGSPDDMTKKAISFISDTVARAKNGTQESQKHLQGLG